jgi:hypothetical protein
MNPITTLVVQMTADGFVEVANGSSIQVGDVLYPWQITELWSDAELHQIHVYRVTPVTPPEGKLATGYTFRFNLDTDRVEQVLTLVDIPPAPVTPRQIRLALSQLGLRQAVEDFVNTQDITVKDSWEYSTQFERNHPLILGAAEALEKTEADIDALFALARSIP